MCGTHAGINLLLTWKKLMRAPAKCEMTQAVTAMEASKEPHVRLIRRREYARARKACFSPRER
jgi:hypothetical protein